MLTHGAKASRWARIQVFPDADALAGDRERCIESGMDDYMTKPVSSAMLAGAVERWTGRKTAGPSRW
jgi:CheY-like chemotaxis protein